MARTCTVCSNPERDAIDASLVSRRSYRDIAQLHDVSISALSRHASAHISPALAVVQAEREHAGGTSLLDRIEDLYGRASGILDAAEADGKVNVSLGAIRELRGITELLGKVTGELKDRPEVVVNILTSPEWVQVRATLLDALAPYPEARLAVAGRLLELEAGP